jgi:type II secretory pathway component PulK
MIPRPRYNSRPHGGILIIAMGITVALSGLVLVFTQQMRVEALASGNLVSQLQADSAVRGAEQHVLYRLANTTDRTTLDTVINSRGANVGDGSFWLIRPNPENEQLFDYGITDEAAKLNINTATVDMLLKLPNMTPELAASIVDWRDADDTVTEGGGAESEYYLLQPDPYYCKNAPFETLDELRLVRGATDELLYGIDANRNGVVDAAELDNGNAASGLSLNGQSQCGIVKYLTVSSIEQNVSSSGQPRTFVGDTDAQTMNGLNRLLQRTLSEERATAIVGRLRGESPALNVLDFYTKSGMKIDEYKQIVDLITTDRQRVLQGRVNVATAPREVLVCLPGLEEADADALIAKRSTSGSETDTLAWVAETLSPEKARLAGGSMTTRSFQYSADIVGVGANGRGFKRVKAVFDLRSSPPRVTYRRDLTHLGWPMGDEPLDTNRTFGQSMTGSTFSQGMR